jgi:Fe-S-cluster containining protein
MKTTPQKVRLELRVLGERVVVEAPQPQGAIRLDEVLPFLRSLDDKAIDVAVRQVEANGKTVSCCKGCSACCRAQPVPITPAEAYALLLLVDALPEPRRTDVRERFADRVRRLNEADLTSCYLDRRPETMAEARAIAQRYFQMGLVCPFLEDDACSIYTERPFVCRQYLVTSPVALCADPFQQPVEPIDMPLAPAGASMQAAEALTGRSHYTIPLTLALDYAMNNRSELERLYPAAEVYRKSVEVLGK